MEKKQYLRVHATLRASAFIVTAVATFVMAFNKQVVNLAGVDIKASFHISPAFKFFLVGNSIGAGYAILSMPFSSNLLEGYLLNLLDMVSTVLVMAAAASATAISYVGKRGNNVAGWPEVCSFYGEFCQKVGISLAFSYFGVVSFLLMCAISSVYRSSKTSNNNS